MNEPAEFLDVAARAARAAGDLLVERFGGPQSGLAAKSSRTDLVSDADRDAEHALTAVIRLARPDDGILGEEGASTDSRSGVRWTVDPLDGTINYLWGIPHWSVSVAAEDDEGDLAAVVLDPCRNEVFAAHRGGAATLNGSPLTLDRSDDLAEALLGVGFAYDSEERARQALLLQRLVAHVRDVRRAGSAALDLAWVAAGRLDAFYETGLNPWDWAGGAMLVRTAGGDASIISSASGPDGFLAARPGLAEPLRALLGEERLQTP